MQSPNFWSDNFNPQVWYHGERVGCRRRPTTPSSQFSSWPGSAADYISEMMSPRPRCGAEHQHQHGPETSQRQTPSSHTGSSFTQQQRLEEVLNRAKDLLGELFGQQPASPTPDTPNRGQSADKPSSSQKSAEGSCRKKAPAASHPKTASGATQQPSCQEKRNESKPSSSPRKTEEQAVTRSQSQTTQPSNSQWSHSLYFSSLAPSKVRAKVRNGQVLIRVCLGTASGPGACQSMVEVTRAVTLPENVDQKTVTAVMKLDGTLVLRAQLKEGRSDEPKAAEKTETPASQVENGGTAEKEDEETEGSKLKPERKQATATSEKKMEISTHQVENVTRAEQKSEMPRLQNDAKGLEPLENKADRQALENKGDHQALENKADHQALENKAHHQALETKGYHQALENKGDHQALENKGDHLALENKANHQALENKGDHQALENKGDNQALENKADKMKALEDRSESMHALEKAEALESTTEAEGNNTALHRSHLEPATDDTESPQSAEKKEGSTEKTDDAVTEEQHHHPEDEAQAMDNDWTCTTSSPYVEEPEDEPFSIGEELSPPSSMEDFVIIQENSLSSEKTEAGDHEEAMNAQNIQRFENLVPQDQAHTEEETVKENTDRESGTSDQTDPTRPIKRSQEPTHDSTENFPPQQCWATVGNMPAQGPAHGGIFCVHLPLQGFSPEDVNVKLVGHTLRINAMRRCWLGEVSYTEKVEKELELPGHLDVLTVKCEYQQRNGCLVINAQHQVPVIVE